MRKKENCRFPCEDMNNIYIYVPMQFFASAIEISQPGHLRLVAPQLFKPTPAGKRRTAMPDDEPPQAGDRILLFRPENLSLLLQGQKVFDARKVNYRSGRYLLGCNGRIYGVARFQRAFIVQTHRVGKDYACSTAPSRRSCRMHLKRSCFECCSRRS